MEIKANMAGMVVSILAKSEDTVDIGDDVIMLESMKMEVPVQAEISGTVSKVKVNIGDFVEEGQVLLELNDESKN